MKLSIITINYNNLEGLKKTAESVLSQTWQDFEWIIVDGGSTDGSAEYIEQLATRLSEEGNTTTLQGREGEGLPWYVERFSMLGFTAEDLKNVGVTQPSTISSQPSLFWCSEPDKGIYNAMNKGISKAKGEYLNFMNSGDYFFENTTLEVVMRDELVEDIIYGNVKEIYDDYTRTVESPENLSFVHLYESALPHQSSFINRNLFLFEGYDEQYRIVSDWQKWIVWLFDDRTFKHINIIVSIVDGTGISKSTPLLNTTERADVLSKILPEAVVNDIKILSSYNKVVSYYPELNEIYFYLQKRHLYKRIVNYMLKIFELISKYL